MAEADTRDAETVLAEIEAEFRRALKANRKFMAFHTAERDHTRRTAEWVPRFGEWVTEVEPFAASYRRISSESPGQMIDCISFSCRSSENLIPGTTPIPY